ITMSATAVLIVSALLLVISFITARHNRTIFGTGLGGDWFAFHNAATILNQHNPARLYDLQLQSHLYHNQLPDEPPEACLPYANAPFLADAFRSFGLMPYAWSYATWTVLSLLMFITGLTFAWRAADLPREQLGFGLLVCLSFEPLSMECIHGGQISAIAVLLFSSAIYLHLSHRQLFAGAILSFCIYKPTLLPIVMLMLLVTRQWRVIAGFFIGTFIIVLFSCMMLGITPWLNYFKILMQYVAFNTSSAGQTVFRTWKFIDLNSFLKLLHLPPTAIALMLLIVTIAAVREAMRIWHSDWKDDPDRIRLAWACALTGTLVLNIYVGIYDSVLVLPGLLLLAGTLRRRDGVEWAVYRCAAVAIFLLPWFSQIVAVWVGFQPYSLGLMILLFLQYQLLSDQNPSLQSDNTKVSHITSTMKLV
ncbi:MAG TPA: glycosyltransferase family 87 protein, partial [Tepidisphaeraceae bacterium]|nr:glycosyltransferase family 87 protein [Tepidisphaeraceae bacterium]